MYIYLTLIIKTGEEKQMSQEASFDVLMHQQFYALPDPALSLFLIDVVSA